MKRGYFIFYGAAVAYCISMLFTLQIENLSTLSLITHQPVVSIGYSGNTCDSERPSRDRDVSSAIESRIPAVGKIYTDREQLKNTRNLKNACHIETKSMSSVHPVFVHYDFLKKIPSFIALNTAGRYSNSFSAKMEIEKHQNTFMHFTGGAKSLGGFYSIVEFPDKRS
ncbi:hypothetical protein [Chryseobacterium angstadtii]|nr:hypothetical protein [Chryseobacterium angstadtii]